MFLIEQQERLNKKPSSNFLPGTIGRIFEYNERSNKNASGFSPVFIKLEPEEKKKKRSIN